MFNTNRFTYGITQSIGDTAVTYALTAARWGVLGYAALTSPEAVRRYRVAGQYLRATCLFCYGLGILSRRAVQAWVDAQVEGATDTPAQATVKGRLLASVVRPPIVIDNEDFAPGYVMPAAVTHPVAAALTEMTLAQLRKACIEHNAKLAPADPRRIARAARLTKAEAIEALRAA